MEQLVKEYNFLTENRDELFDSLEALENKLQDETLKIVG
jgi:hypothetical protein